MHGNKFVVLGGGIIVLLFLLPSLIFCYTVKGLSLSYAMSDNLYFLAAKEGGSLFSLKPFFRYTQLFDVEWNGNYYLINFNTDYLFLENSLAIQKHLYLPGAGNRNSIYARLYNLFTPSFNLYRYTTISAGDSVNVYLFNRFLLSPDLSVSYHSFDTDSMLNYMEPYAKSSLSIPMPYFFFIPGAGLGAKIYEHETLPFYRIFSGLSFPLTMDLSIEARMMYCHCVSSTGGPSMEPILYDEPFYEEESLEESISGTIYIKKLFQENRTTLDIQGNVFKKHFFPVEDMDRSDSGASIHLRLAKMLDPGSSISVSFESLLNASTLDDFDYTTNAIEIQLNLIY